MTAQGAPRHMPACQAKDGASYFGTTEIPEVPSVSVRVVRAASWCGCYI